MSTPDFILYKRGFGKRSVVFYLVYHERYIIYRWIVGTDTSWEDNDHLKSAVGLDVPFEFRTQLIGARGSQLSNPLEFLLLTGANLYSSFGGTHVNHI